MLNVIKTDQADDDLYEIWKYIADENETAADRLIERIDDKFMHIAKFPEIGRERPELAKNLRSCTVGNYLIFYQIKKDVLIVIRVLHGMQDLPTLFDT